MTVPRIGAESVLYPRTADGADMADSSNGTSVTLVIESGTAVPTTPKPPIQGHLPKTGGLLDLTLLLAVLLMALGAVLLRSTRSLLGASVPDTPRTAPHPTSRTAPSLRRNP